MAHLDKLKISNRIVAAARPRRKEDTVEYRRKKLIANVEEQIELAELALQGRPPRLKRKRGHGLVTVRPRLWWKMEPDVQILAQVRYNKVALSLGGRGRSIEVGSLKKLPSAFRVVIRAIKAGELDRAIHNAVKVSGK